MSDLLPWTTAISPLLIKMISRQHVIEYFTTYTEYINGKLTNAVHGIAGLLRDQGYRSLPMPTIAPTDQRFLKAVFSYKDAAELAGLGSVGRHTMLITPE